ncbi:MAG TPA: dTMP kinase [Candidatus Omnitrophica bacterium]|nr:dTMP kinase [Candidatus Omnitrophota bacterium]
MEARLKGRFITFEGSEGSGKSTQIGLVDRYLKRKGRKVLFLREPGATRISEQVRRILLDVGSAGMSDECETLLYMAARAQLVREKIIPALREGVVVLCDRFLDSTVAYQGYGNGVDIGWIKELGRFTTGGVTPDLTFFFDIDAKKGLGRIRRPKDRIERRSILYHDRVRTGYRTLARQEPGRIKLIKVDGNKEEIHLVVRKHIDSLLGL